MSENNREPESDEIEGGMPIMLHVLRRVKRDLPCLKARSASDRADEWIDMVSGWSDEFGHPEYSVEMLSFGESLVHVASVVNALAAEHGWLSVAPYVRPLLPVLPAEGEPDLEALFTAGDTLAPYLGLVADWFDRERSQHGDLLPLLPGLFDRWLAGVPDHVGQAADWLRHVDLRKAFTAAVAVSDAIHALTPEGQTAVLRALGVPGPWDDTLRNAGPDLEQESPPGGDCHGDETATGSGGYSPGWPTIQGAVGTPLGDEMDRQVKALQEALDVEQPAFLEWVAAAAVPNLATLPMDALPSLYREWEMAGRPGAAYLAVFSGRPPIGDDQSWEFARTITRMVVNARVRAQGGYDNGTVFV